MDKMIPTREEADRQTDETFARLGAKLAHIEAHLEAVVAEMNTPEWKATTLAEIKAEMKEMKRRKETR